VENVVGIDGGSVGRRLIVAGNHCTRRLSAEDESGVELGLGHDYSLKREKPHP
jgi:hypothetical protein